MTNEKLCTVNLLMLGGSGPYVVYFYCLGFRIFRRCKFRDSTCNFSISPLLSRVFIFEPWICRADVSEKLLYVLLGLGLSFILIVGLDDISRHNCLPYENQENHSPDRHRDTRTQALKF
ncbi:hypothetical protein HOY82DRAFT_309534 [Tuber indicum]|nr:hypothetical protein HOY82DRAFT_309534 [Tuber indicum]